MRKNFKDSKGKKNDNLQEVPPTRLSTAFSAEILYNMREWNDILKIQKDKNCHPKILYPTKLSYRCNREKNFPKQKLRKFNIKLPYKRCWKRLYKPETKQQKTHKTLRKVLNRQRNKTAAFHQNRFLNTLLQHKS